MSNVLVRVSVSARNLSDQKQLRLKGLIWLILQCSSLPLMEAKAGIKAGTETDTVGTTAPWLVTDLLTLIFYPMTSGQDLDSLQWAESSGINNWPRLFPYRLSYNPI